MKDKTYAVRISDILMQKLKADGYGVSRISTGSPFIAKVQITNSHGGRINVKGELAKNLNDIHIKVTIPSIRRERYNVVCQMAEPFANTKMLQEAADKMYQAFKNSL